MGGVTSGTYKSEENARENKMSKWEELQVVRINLKTTLEKTKCQSGS